MKVTDVKRVFKALNAGQFPSRRMPEIAFAGRSNVGKSSLINAQLHRHNIVPTSRTPGKTRSIDFYLVNQTFHFVDLPGYGYAAVAKSRKDYWGELVGEYIAANPHLRLVCLLLDLRRVPSELDMNMAGMLERAEVPTVLVATKTDKVGKSKQTKALAAIAREFGLEDERDAIVMHSAKTGLGTRALWRIIEDSLG
jgi:GTP-binding protein